MVRQRPLEAPFVGSNPTTPGRLIILFAIFIVYIFISRKKPRNVGISNNTRFREGMKVTIPSLGLEGYIVWGICNKYIKIESSTGNIMADFEETLKSLPQKDKLELNLISGADNSPDVRIIG